MSEIDLRNRKKELETEVFYLKLLFMVLLAENLKLREDIQILRNNLSLNSKNISKPTPSDVFINQTKTLRKEIKTTISDHVIQV